MNNREKFVDYTKADQTNEAVGVKSIEEINESNQELFLSELKTLDIIIELSNDAVNNLNVNNQYNSEVYDDEVSRSVRFVNNQKLNLQQSKAVVGKRYESFADDLKKSQDKFDGSINIYNKWHHLINGITNMSVDEFNSSNDQANLDFNNSTKLDIDLANSVNEIENVIEHINSDQHLKVDDLKNQTNRILKEIYNLDNNDYRKANGMPDIDELNSVQIKLVNKLDKILIMLDQQIVNDISNTEQLASDTKTNFQPKNKIDDSHRLELESMFK